MSNEIFEGIDKLKNRLVDITRRNKLIKYKPSKTYNLIVINCSLEGLFENLIVRENSLTFQALPEWDGEGEIPNKLQWANQLGLSVDIAIEKNAEQENDKIIQTLHFPDEMNKILLRIYREAKSFEQEMGRNMLYLCMGILKWKDVQHTQEYNTSPLVCIPLEITRSKTASNPEFSINYASQDQIHTNQALKEKLKLDHNIILPDYEENDTYSTYIQKIKKVVENKKDWNIEHTLNIDFLKFEKILMYQDLKEWKGKIPLCDVEVFRDIFFGREVDGHPFAKEYNIDELNELQDYPLVLDADSSQHSAIIDAMSGKHMVIEGPPGSGKSQTITNLIASFLARKKRVLFVSEKSAALDVVYGRMKKIGLGDFCLELHSHKSKTNHVLESIKNRIERRDEPPRAIDQCIQKIQLRKQEIKEYLDVLHQTYGRSGCKIFEIFWAVEKYRDIREKAYFEVINAVDWDSQKLYSVQNLLENCREVYKELSHTRTPLNFWDGLNFSCFNENEKERLITFLSATQSDFQEISNLLQYIGVEDTLIELNKIKDFENVEFTDRGDEFSLFAKNLILIEEKLDALKDYTDCIELNFQEILAILEAIEMIGKIDYAQYQKLDYSMINADVENQISRFEKENLALQSQLEKVAGYVLDIRDIFKTNLEQWEEVDVTLKRYRGSMFTFLSSKYREAKRSVQGILKTEFLKNKESWLECVREIRSYLEMHDRIERDNGFSLAFGKFFNGVNTDIVQIKNAHLWLLEFCNKVANAQYFIAHKIPLEIPSKMHGVIEEIANLDLALSRIKTHLNLDEIFSKGIYKCTPLELSEAVIQTWQILHASFSMHTKKSIISDLKRIKILEDLKFKVEDLQNKISGYGIEFDIFFGSCPSVSQCLQKIYQVSQAGQMLSKWVSFKRFTSNPLLADVPELVGKMQDRKLADSEIIHAFLYNFYRSLLKKAFEEFPILENFEKVTYDRAIEDFKNLDKQLLKLNVKRIASECMNYPHVDHGNHFGGSAKDRREKALLQAEIGKKKKHLKLRQLISRAPKSLQSLKPCFMMSPLSVAQYLDPSVLDFDVLIVDEASQLRPEEALGAIARCRQIIIVGDPKQLPPTDFFRTKQENDEEDEEEINPANESESILDMCLKIYQPVRQLRWHYRSKHEDLIRFSNAEFYDNNLIVFPTPHHGQTNSLMGIGYHYIEEGRWHEERNQIEAERLVQYLVELIQKYPEKSIGVATFNKNQSVLIQEMIDTEEINNEFLSDYKAKFQEKGEPFFVKNLENIQGDERDVILISTTYGKDKESSKLHMRFGPISREGGWRRLNVILTRARERMEFFTSMKSQEILPSGSRERTTLKRLLEFIEQRKIQGLPILSNRDFDSDFEISVYRVLKQYGFEVVPQVGVSEYYIDLAVQSSSKNLGFILAVECDGATYHSSKSARDRDRLRQEVLENLGWSVYRIWSVDWYKNREVEIEKLITRVKETQIEFDAKIGN